jgi:hypothetical protein
MVQGKVLTKEADNVAYCLAFTICTVCKYLYIVLTRSTMGTLLRPRINHCKASLFFSGPLNPQTKQQ